MEAIGVVLAAGMSRRMGRGKLTLPWRGRTVIGQVASTLIEAGLGEIIAVTGHEPQAVAQALAGFSQVRLAFNPDYATGEMLSSVQAGLAAAQAADPAGERLGAALLCLGDQPQMKTATVAAVAAAGQAAAWQTIVIPSYQYRAGHPILLPRWLWPAILAERASLRALLAQRRDVTHYLIVDTPTVLADLDTPADYAAAEA